MHRVGTSWARYFNDRYGHEGYVFQGRFGSRRIDEDGDLRNVVRYVHRNPLVAGRVASLVALESHRWCGHGAAMGRIPAEPFHDVLALLELFGDSPATARAVLHDGMLDESAAAAPCDESEVALAELIESVCRESCVDVATFRAGGRSRAVTAARAVITRIARRELGISDAKIAAALGVTRQALWRRIGRDPHKS
jgi:hypothetical protein